MKISFQNTGNQPLIITNANGSGSPTVEKPPEPILPNETGYIKPGLYKGAIGKFRQPAYVSTNINDSITVISIELEVVGMNGERKVTGTVKDSSGQAIPFASISILNSQLITTSSFSGHYSLLAKPTDTLYFRAVAYFEHKVAAFSEEIDIVLSLRPNPRADHDLPRYANLSEKDSLQAISDIDLKKPIIRNLILGNMLTKILSFYT